MADVGEFPESNAASIDAWRTNAEFWDAAQGDAGNFWQRELIFPPTLELLEPLPERVLEIACGNGNFARALARRGVAVTATDASAEMLALARERSIGLADADRLAAGRRDLQPGSWRRSRARRSGRRCATWR